MNVKYLGIDIAKDVFQLCGMSRGGAIVLSKRLRRKQLLAFVANIPPCTIGIEACGGGANDEFLLTATAQNLRRMGKYLGTGPPKISEMAVT